MAYRGRLIFPFIVELAQLDLAATSAAGYDADFKETKIVASSDLLGASTRTETLIKVPMQFVNTNAFLQLQESATGNLARTEFVGLFHFADLEAASLIESSTGLAKIKVGDRLSAVYTPDGITVVQKVRNPPGVFITRAQPLFGLNSVRNLLEVTFSSRDPGGQAS